MKNEKLKIIFDTNILRQGMSACLSEIFSSSLDEVLNFLHKYKLKEVLIAIPEMVIKERMYQRLDDITVISDNIKKNANKIKIFKINFNLDQLNNLNYHKVITNKVNLFLKKHSIGKIKTIKIDQEMLIKRSLGKIKPFGGEDRGFKDTVI
jgi:hypothetical protein